MRDKLLTSGGDVTKEKREVGVKGGEQNRKSEEEVNQMSSVFQRKAINASLLFECCKAVAVRFERVNAIQ